MSVAVTRCPRALRMALRVHQQQVIQSFSSQTCRGGENGSYFIIAVLLQTTDNMFSNRALGVVDNSLSCNQSCDIDALFSPANFTCQTVVLVLALLLTNK